MCAVERCLLAPVASLDSQSRMTVFSFARIAAVELACHCRGHSALRLTLTQPMIPDRTCNHTGESPRCGLKQMNCVSRHFNSRSTDGSLQATPNCHSRLLICNPPLPLLHLTPLTHCEGCCRERGSKGCHRMEKECR